MGALNLQRGFAALAVMAFAGTLLAQNPGRSSPTATAPVATQMRNVSFRYDDDLALYIGRLDGTLRATKPGSIPSFDDKRSFLIEISSAEVAIDMQSLARLLNGYVFADPASGLKNIQVSVSKGRLQQKATMHKGIDMPVELTGTVSVTPSGKIRIHPTKIHAAHLPFNPLMKVLGLKVSDFVNDRKTHGLSVEKNDLIFDPEVALPAPHIRARVIRVRLEGDRLIQTLASPTPDNTLLSELPAEDVTRGYLRYRGGVLKFGKLTMRPADLTIINSSKQGPLDFFLDHYQQQLVAGETKATSNYGWIVYMPSYSVMVSAQARVRTPAN